MRPSYILIVEDDRAVRAFLALTLRQAGFSVVEASSVVNASKLLAAIHFDAIVLDLELDDGVGYEILRPDAGRRIPTVVISSRVGVEDRLTSLELGAQDYMVKPIDGRELLLRLRRALDRTNAAPPQGSREHRIAIDPALSLDVAKRELVGEGQKPVSLAANEFHLLCKFLTSAGKVVRREVIARDVMHKRVLAGSRAVDVMVSALRRKLMLANSSHTLVSVRGEGYAMRQDGGADLPAAANE